MADIGLGRSSGLCRLTPGTSPGPSRLRECACPVSFERRGSAMREGEEGRVDEEGREGIKRRIQSLFCIFSPEHNTTEALVASLVGGVHRHCPEKDSAGSVVPHWFQAFQSSHVCAE